MKPNLNEMITLSKKGDFIKKVQATTLMLYGVKEIEMCNSNMNFKENLDKMKKWLAIWQEKYSTSDKLIKIYDVLYNTPEGFASIITEYMDGGSLKDILDQTFTLNEICNIIFITF